MMHPTPHTPQRLQTTLTPAQEHIVVELRKTFLLPLDDLLAVTREFLCPQATRSGLDRCLRRHGVGNLNALKPKEPASLRRVGVAVDALLQRGGVHRAGSYGVAANALSYIVCCHRLGQTNNGGLAGHRSIATTQKYVTVNDDMKRKAVELV